MDPTLDSSGTRRLDPRTPVLVGVGQFNNRVDRGAEPLEPVDLMVEALRRAEADSGGTGVLAATDSVRVISILSWRYLDPGALVAERLGLSPRHTLYSSVGGNMVQSLVNRSARDIAAGDADVVLLAGGEAWRTRSSAKKGGSTLEWTHQEDGTAPTETYGGDFQMSAPEEVERGLFLPIQTYPLFDIALRGAEGLGVDEHRRRIAELWSRFSEVAADNPEAWIQRRYTPEEIGTPSADNRMVGFPYTKLMNSNNAVEQGAALILCSVEKARALGVPTDRWVFPRAGTDANDNATPSHRVDLHSSPAIRVAGRRALELAGIGVDDLAHVDLYSCFPSAVQIAARELGLGLDRQLTVTGGLSFAGGPWNNYVTHAIATMAGILREDPGSVGLCTANGGNLSKHAFGVYATTPPPAGFVWESCQAGVDAHGSRAVLGDYDGPATVEAYTVMHSRDGEPEKAFAAALTASGERVWATSADTDLLAALEAEEHVGRTASVATDGTFTIA